MIVISAALNNVRLQAVLDFLAAGTGQAKAVIYSGQRPDFGGTGGTGAMLVEIPLPEPAGVVDNGVLTLTASDEVLVTTTGTATWGRIVNGDGVIAFDCDASDINGTGEIKLPTDALYAGGYTRLASGALS